MRSRWKDPASVEPFEIDYTAYLAELGEDVILNGSTWTVSDVPGDPDPPTLGAGSIIVGGRVAQVVMSGGYAPVGPPGTRGNEYWVTNHFTTTSGVVDERSFLV
jgi:hypothetical protein